MKITQKNIRIFHSIFNKNPVIIYYYMDRCPWCDRLDPIWKKFKTQAKSILPKLKVVKIENQNRDLLKFDSGVFSFPTIKLYNNGKEIAQFDEERTVNNLLNFIKKQNLASLSKRKSLKKKKSLKRKKSLKKKKSIKH